MKNLEAKQEAIKKAYGENYIHADKNGWIRHLMYCPSDLGIENYDDIDGFWRCKSLQEIENNKGWIRIESEADLPKEGIHHSILLDSDCINGYRNYDVIVFYEVNSRYRKKEISHYHPIEKPKLPIY